MGSQRVGWLSDWTTATTDGQRQKTLRNSKMQRHAFCYFTFTKKKKKKKFHLTNRARWKRPEHDLWVLRSPTNSSPKEKEISQKVDSVSKLRELRSTSLSGQASRWGHDQPIPWYHLCETWSRVSSRNLSDCWHTELWDDKCVLL